MKKYRVFTLMGIMALTAGSLMAQDYDDIYYDASKSKTVEVKTKSSTPAKTVVVYGDVPEKYKVAAQDNYRVERDEDEYNRRGAYDPTNAGYEVDINGDTIYDDEAFANTRRIERFYNPDVVILSDDDDLVELYYDESPTVNLIIGSDNLYSSYGWTFSSYYPWYTGWYTPWYYRYGWYSPYYDWYWSWGYRPYYSWHSPYWGWGGYYGWHSWGWGRPYNWAANGMYPYDHHHYDRWGGHNSGYHWGHHDGGNGRRAGLATNRNGRSRVDYGTGANRNRVSAPGSNGNRPSGVSGSGSRSRGGYASTRNNGNIGTRNSGVAPRNGHSVSRPSSAGSRSYSGGGSSSYGGSRSSGGYSGGSRSSGGYSSGSSGRSSGSSGGGGGGSHGGGGHRR